MFAIKKIATTPALSIAMVICAAFVGATQARAASSSQQRYNKQEEESREEPTFGDSTSFGFTTRIRPVTSKEQRQFMDIQLKLSNKAIRTQEKAVENLEDIAKNVAAMADKDKKAGKKSNQKTSTESVLTALQTDVRALRIAMEKQTKLTSMLVGLMRQQAITNQMIFGFTETGGATPSTPPPPNVSQTAPEAPSVPSQAAPPPQVNPAFAERVMERRQERAAKAVSVKDAPPEAKAPVSEPKTVYEEPHLQDGKKTAPKKEGSTWIIR